MHSTDNETATAAPVHKAHGNRVVLNRPPSRHVSPKPPARALSWRSNAFRPTSVLPAESRV